MSRSTARGQVIALVLGVLAVSWAAPLIRLAEAPAVVVAALRLAIAAPPVAVAALCWRRDELRSLTRGDAALLAGAGLALACHFLAWVAAVQQTSVIASAVLVTKLIKIYYYVIRKFSFNGRSRLDYHEL